jgi:hypothetical protein
MRRGSFVDRDLAACGIIFAALAVQLLAPCLRGLTPFWGDLTYIHHPWRAFDAETLQAGRLPLWDPYLYFGMPAAATMQNSVFYPGSVPFFFFGFSSGLLLYHLIHYGLSAFLSLLWLRSCGLKRTAAISGAGLLCLGGVWLENRPFVNHLAVLALLPGLCLLARRPFPLAICLCAAFLAGYPQIFVGSAAAAFVFALALGGRRGELLRGWASAGAWAAALSGCLLLPAVELVRLSHRSAGVGLDEALNFGFAPADLIQWISPWLLKAFDPAVEWWKSCFMGFAGLALAALGLFVLPRRRAAVFGAWLVCVLLIILGGTNPVSAALWSRLPLLRFVRYPGNFSYLAVPVLALLAAAGVDMLSARVRVLAAALLIVELSVYGMGSLPLAGTGLFAYAGPLVRRLQAELGGHRYLLSPKALEAGRGADYEDWKHRLYGMTNEPFHLRAAASFGEPLVPQANYEVMDRLLGAKSAAAAAELFPWTDVRALLTPGLLPASAEFSDAGQTLWRVNRFLGPAAGAYAFSEADGERLPESLPRGAWPRPGRELVVERPREDRFSISGQSPESGWVYAAEPRYPGWRISLKTERGDGTVESLPALGAFQKVHVPAGSWRLDFRYEPDSWRHGLILSLCALLAFALRALGLAKRKFE